MPLDPATVQAQGVSHGEGKSTVQLDGGVSVSGSLVADATGHSRKLVEFDKAFNPGEHGKVALGKSYTAVPPRLAVGLQTS
jgi:hypothetical protein